MSDKSETSSQDPKRVLMALATAPIAIIAAATPIDAAIADEVPAPEILNTAASLDQVAPTALATSLPKNQSVHTVVSGETLPSIAKLHGLSQSELRRINNLTDASLLLPGQVLKLIGNTVQPAVLDRVTAPIYHTVKPGENIAQIAGHYSISVKSLLAINNLQERSLIFPGQKLTVRDVSPSKQANKQTTSGPREHVVTLGETLGDIARVHNISLTSLLKANSLTRTSLIFVGQVLDIPNVNTAASVYSNNSITGNVIGQPTSICLFHGFHKIKAGETISKIAAIFGVPSQALLSVNSLTWNSTIYIGQKLVIPDVHGALDCPKLTPLSDEMTQNANQIIAIGRELGVGDYGIVIALAAAMQESSLRNVAFGDRDSIGLFQQRPSAHWGTKDQIMDSNYSIRAFFGGAASPSRGAARGLLDISGWQRLSLTEAAQAVQISAHPTAYAKWEPSAWKWLIQLDQLEDS